MTANRADFRADVRTNYDELAAHYDEHPYRQKEVDRQLQQFLAERGLSADELIALDMGCGTGSQLAVNSRAWPQARWVGLDLFAGMLQQGLPKARGVNWVQGNNAQPPFRTACFHYISNQFSFHHVRDKTGMMRAVYRMLRGNGRFTMTNIVPHKMPNWIVYQFFPETYATDLRDFPSVEGLVMMLQQIGFSHVHVETEHWIRSHALRDFANEVQQRHPYSQLTTLSEIDYRAGWQRLQIALAQANTEPVWIDSEMCLLTLTADKE